MSVGVGTVGLAVGIVACAPVVVVTTGAVLIDPREARVDPREARAASRRLCLGAAGRIEYELEITFTLAGARVTVRWVTTRRMLVVVVIVRHKVRVVRAVAAGCRRLLARGGAARYARNFGTASLGNVAAGTDRAGIGTMAAGASISALIAEPITPA